MLTIRSTIAASSRLKPACAVLGTDCFDIARVELGDIVADANHSGHHSAAVVPRDLDPDPDRTDQVTLTVDFRAHPFDAMARSAYSPVT